VLKDEYTMQYYAVLHAITECEGKERKQKLIEKEYKDFINGLLSYEDHLFTN
jgi:hypothetical protein